MKKLIIILIIAVFFIAGCNEEAETNSNTPDTGSNAVTDIEMEVLNGDNVSLNDLKGKVVALDFWASWCGPCRKSIPFYNKMHEKYADKGLVIIGINANENRSTIEGAMSELDIAYPVAMPEERMNQHFKVQGIPSMYLFDREGNEIDNFVGYSPELDNKIESLIMEYID
ncbi:MAG: TlpA disulfide reductase family protein [bacterium]